MISRNKIEKILGRKFDDDGYLSLDMVDIHKLLMELLNDDINKIIKKLLEVKNGI